MATAVSETFRRQGFVYVRNVLSEEGVQTFRQQLEKELTDPPEGPTHDRTATSISLNDRSSWPRKGARRVIECAPLSQGPHWDEIMESQKLRSTLDTLLGVGNWELPRNTRSEPGGGPQVRHWYCPVVCPERGPEQPQSKPAKKIANDPRRSNEVAHMGLQLRPMLVCSWKEEVKANGPMVTHEAGWRWQPTNRRRVCGKGWHIDIGPGFDTSWSRTLEGHPYQGAVVLLLLSDWRSGSGGTAMVPGSHYWVRERLRLAGEKGLSHDDINQQCIDHLLRLAASDKVWIPCEDNVDAIGNDGSSIVLTVPPAACQQMYSSAPALNLASKSLAHSARVDIPEPIAEGDGEGYVLHQCCGKAGDIVVMHPWLIHSGTTNCGESPRLMANGMVRIKQSSFVTNGNQILSDMAI